MKEERFSNLENIMKERCFNPPIYCISSDAAELVSETKKDENQITLVLDTNVSVQLGDTTYSPEDGDNLIISFENESDDNVKLNIIDGFESDGLYFERGKEYPSLDIYEETNTIIINFKSLPAVIQDKAYTPGIVSLFPFLQRSTRYIRAEYGVNIATDIYGFLTPEDLDMKRLDTIIDRVSSSTDINNHFTKVNYKESYYRALPTLDMVSGSVIVESSKEGDKIFLVDGIEESNTRFESAYVLGNSLDPRTEEMNMGIIYLSNMIEDMSRFIVINEEPIFTMDENGETRVLISPFVEGDVGNDALVQIAVCIEEVYALNKQCQEQIDSDKLNKVIDKVNNGGRIDRKRNKIVKAVKEAYDNYNDYIASGRLDLFYDPLITQDGDYKLYLYHEDTRKLVRFNPSEVTQIAANLANLVRLFGLE